MKKRSMKYASRQEDRGGNSAKDSGRAWIPVFFAALFVVGCAAGFAWLMQPRAETGLKSENGTQVVARDVFARSGRDGLGSAFGGRDWVEWSGKWTISASTAHVLEPSELASMVGISAGADASITATVSGNANCGLFASAIDAENRIEVVKQPLKSTWSIRRVDRASVVELGTLPAKRIGEIVTIAVDRPVVTVTVGDRKTSFLDDEIPNGNYAGLIAQGASPKSCLFDDVVVFVPDS